MRHSLLEHLEDRFLLAATPQLVADLNTSGLSSWPTEFTVFNNALYFSAYDDQHGRALWKFDGEQTTLAADIAPGPGNGFNGPEELTVFNGALYFRAADATHGIELWKFDGTTASLAADIKPGIATDPSFNSSRPNGLSVIGDKLYFSADDGVSGREIWSFDGQSATRLADLNPGPADSEPYGKTYRFTEFGGAMYFFANPGDSNDRLFRFDGQNIVRIDQAGGVPLLSPFYDDEMIVFDGTLYFTGAAPGKNLDREFWKYDGNSFSRVADIRVGQDGSWPSGYFIFNDALYFWAQRDPEVGIELFKYDGVNVTPTGESRPYPQGTSTVFGGQYYRSVGEHLARFDGSHFSPVSDVPIGTDIAAFGDAIYVAGQFQPNGQELARYDGNSIALVADLRPGTESSGPGSFSSFNGTLYFTADSNQSSHAEIWKLDGSGAQMADPSREYFLPTAMVSANGHAYFAASNDGDDGYELWRYDGDHSTKVIANESGFNVYPPQLGTFGNDVLFWGYGTLGGDGPTISGLWAFDGTMARPIAPGLTGIGVYENASSFTNFKGALYLLASEEPYGRLELWKFDGNSVDRAPGIAAGSLAIAPGMKLYDGALYFGASDQTTSGLWKYDGTQATLAAEFQQDGSYFSYPSQFEIHEGSLYFSANGDQFGYQLWRYNVNSGAQRITSDLPGGPGSLASLAGLLYFSANGALWSYDGVEAKQISDLAIGSSFFRFKGALYFGADDELHGFELWKIEPDVRVGDLNRDGAVSIADFITLSSNFGKSNIGWSGGDLNYDNEVSIADFMQMAANFGQNNPQPALAQTTAPAAKAKKPLRQAAKLRPARHRARHHRPRPMTLLRF